MFVATHEQFACQVDTIEEAVRFGPDQHLVGIVVRPAVPVIELPTLVFLNAGVLHRVGPHRLHVILARELARLGFTSLRLDLSGIGDSPAAGDDAFGERAVIDVRAALDMLERTTGQRAFVLFGLCSGADNSIATALVEDRVIGLVLLDSHGYVTSRSRVRGLMRTLQNTDVRDALPWGEGLVARQVRRQLDVLKRRVRPDVTSAIDPSTVVAQDDRETPPLEVHRDQLTRLVDRGVRILAVYSGALGELFNDADQLFEWFPELRGRVDRLYFPEANHTFTELSAQGQLVTAVKDWLGREFSLRVALPAADR